MYIISFILFIDFLGFGLILPLTPLFQSLYSLTAFQVGLFTSVFFISNLVGSLIFGPLSDKWGRKPLLLISTFGLAIFYLINSINQLYINFNSFLWMLILRIIIGFFSGNIPVVFACSVDITSQDIESRRKAMALMGSIIGLSFMLGPSLGGILALCTVSQTIAPFYFSSIISFICFILVLFFFKETLNKNFINNNSKEKNYFIFKQLYLSLTNLKLLVPLLLFVGFFFSFTGFEVYLITMVLGEHLHLSQLSIGIFWTAFAFSNTIFQFLLLKVANLRMSLIIGFIVYSLGILSYTITSSSMWLVGISMLICSIGIGFILPNISTLVSLEGSPKEKGLVFAINQSFGSIGRFLGPFLLGWIYTIFNTINAIWIFMFILMFLQAIIVLRIIPKNLSD